MDDFYSVYYKYSNWLKTTIEMCAHPEFNGDIYFTETVDKIAKELSKFVTPGTPLEKLWGDFIVKFDKDYPLAGLTEALETKYIGSEKHGPV